MSVLNIFGVYLPCHNGTSKQIELYAETLELLQDAIGKFWNKIKKARGAKHNTKNAICLER